MTEETIEQTTDLSQESLIVFAAVRLHSSGNEFIDFGSAQLTPEDCQKVIDATDEHEPQFGNDYPVQYIQRMLMIPLPEEEEGGEEE